MIKNDRNRVPCNDSKRSFGGYDCKFFIEVYIVWHIKLWSKGDRMNRPKSILGISTDDKLSRSK